LVEDKVVRNKEKYPVLYRLEAEAKEDFHVSCPRDFAKILVRRAVA
jgi:hypothetical protein